LAGPSLTLLGTPALSVGGAPHGLPLGEATGTALLPRARTGPQSRERLASLVWGEHPDAAARAPLR